MIFLELGLLNDFSAEDILKSIRQILPLSDPFSILGVIEIALFYQDKNNEFNILAKELIEKLCNDELPDKNGIDIYTYYPELINLCLAKLREINGMGKHPPFWHRLCAYTHASILLKIFSNLHFDPIDLATWLKKGVVPNDFIADSLALHDEPMWRTDHLTRKHLQAEITGRLKILVEKEKKKNKEMPCISLIDKSFERFEFICSFAGPLEGHMRPIHINDDRKITKEKLLETFNTPIEKYFWPEIEILTLKFYLSDEIRKDIIKVIPDIILPNELQEKIFTLSHIALIAVAHEDEIMASAVVDRVLYFVKEFETIQNIFFLMLISSGAVVGKRWSDWLSVQLERLANLVTLGNGTEELYMLIQQLKKYTPIEHWKFCRAEAKCLSATEWK